MLNREDYPYNHRAVPALVVFCGFVAQGTISVPIIIRPGEEQAFEDFCLAAELLHIHTQWGDFINTYEDRMVPFPHVNIFGVTTRPVTNPEPGFECEVTAFVTVEDGHDALATQAMLNLVSLRNKELEELRAYGGFPDVHFDDPDWDDGTNLTDLPATEQEFTALLDGDEPEPADVLREEDDPDLPPFNLAA